MADMSDPYDAMQATVDHCRFMAAEARRAAEDAAARAEVWDAAGREAESNLRAYTEWNPKPAPTTAKEA